MNKRNSLAILVLSSVFILASCGGMPTPPETSKNSSASTSQSSGKTSKDSSSKESKESKESQPSNPSTPSTPSEPSTPSTPSEPGTVYTVTFETNGGTTIDPVEVAKGDTLARPADPTKLGFDFENWYEDAALTLVYDFSEPVMASFTLYANWTPVQQSTEESNVPETRTIYFKDAAWWNNYAPMTFVSFTEIDPSTATEFGTQTTWISYDEVEKFNYVSVEVPEDAEGIMFIRVYFDETELVNKYGGSCTSFLTIPEDKDMFVLDGDAWSDHAEGHWAVYGDEPEPTSSDTQTSTPTGEDPYGPEGADKSDWYIVGEGANFHGWSFDGGLQLWVNPGNVEDKGCALNVFFTVGDLFKVTDGNTWFGYEGVDKWDDPSNAGLYCFEGADDGYGGKNFSCTVEGYYDVYVNKSGSFWIQVHA